MQRGITSLESIFEFTSLYNVTQFHLRSNNVCFHFLFSFPPLLLIARGFHDVETPSRPRDRLNAKKRWQRGCSRIFSREHHRLGFHWICNAKGDVLGAIVELLGSLTRDECRFVLRIIRFSTIYHGNLSNDLSRRLLQLSRKFLRNFPRFRPFILEYLFLGV